jgi:K(+)-stimulated pyrophosphate-energized sodium pump
MKSWILYLIPLAGLAGIAFAIVKANWVKAQDAGTDRMKEIAGFVKEGAMAFLKREYRVLAIFVVTVAVALGVANALGESTDVAYRNPLIALSFVLGAFCSALAGWVGMQVATNANVRTTNAARTSLNGALKVAFSGGTVMGMMVVGLSVTGLGVLILVYGKFGVVGDMMATGELAARPIQHVVTVLSGFSLGASSIALFARVGGGIYTKAADVGADLVGKVEAGIPEDDPRNPAVIADNVGDNVGDVAGMGADLFESFVGSIIGTMVLGVMAMGTDGEYVGLNMVTLPLVIAGAGILVSIGATFLVSTKEGGNPQTALNTGTFAAAGIMVPVIFGLCYWLMGGDVAFPTWEFSGTTFERVAKVVSPWKMGLAATGGLLAGVLVGMTTEYYCSKDGKKSWARKAGDLS